MNPVLQTIIDTAHKCRDAEISRYEAFSEFNKSNEEIDSLIYNHSVSQAEAARICGFSENTFREKVKLAIETNVIPELQMLKNRYLFTLEHLHLMMDWLKLPKVSDTQNCNIINMQNQKGGTGKSTTAFTLATGIALDVKKRAKVLVIDLDPHGTLRNFVAAKPEDYNSMLTTVDLMLGPIEPNSIYAEYIESGYDHESLVKDAILRTHIPTLDVLPAFETDSRFNDYALKMYYESGSMFNALALMEANVLSLLRDSYDYIFIDTGPHSTPLVWSTMDVCDGIIFPVSPRKLDWIVTSAFLNNIENIFAALPNKGNNLKFSKLLIVNFDDEKNRDLEMMYYIQETVGRFAFKSFVKRSTAFEVANKHYRTIYDLRASDGLCPKIQLEKAMTTMKDVILDFNLIIKELGNKK
jgi:cellulose biosynthesis protein BcsQ